jgi:hypothetical protein
MTHKIYLRIPLILCQLVVYATPRLEQADKNAVEEYSFLKNNPLALKHYRATQSDLLDSLTPVAAAQLLEDEQSSSKFNNKETYTFDANNETRMIKKSLESYKELLLLKIKSHVTTLKKDVETLNIDSDIKNNFVTICTDLGTFIDNSQLRLHTLKCIIYRDAFEITHHAYGLSHLSGALHNLAKNKDHHDAQRSVKLARMYLTTITDSNL